MFPVTILFKIYYTRFVWENFDASDVSQSPNIRLYGFSGPQNSQFSL